MIIKNKTKGWHACVGHAYSYIISFYVILFVFWSLRLNNINFIESGMGYEYDDSLGFVFFGHLIKTFFFASYLFRVYSFTTDILIPSYPFENWYVEHEPLPNQCTDHRRSNKFFIYIFISIPFPPSVFDHKQS